MPQASKITHIKLIPRRHYLRHFIKWRLISLMGRLYEVFRKVLANILQKCLPNLIQLAQYGFIVGRNILHNILNIQIAMHYTKDTYKCLIMVQLDLEKAYDHVNWSFVSG